jgi:hypothetical protein
VRASDVSDLLHVFGGDKAAALDPESLQESVEPGTPGHRHTATGTRPRSFVRPRLRRRAGGEQTRWQVYSARRLAARSHF